jgi:hypothetical protein
LASISQVISAFLNRDLWSPKVTASILDLGAELIFGIGVFLFLIFVLVPFILPATSIGVALKSVLIFAKFLLGRVGRAVLVENGEMKTVPFMQDHSTTRPLILDNASAGLIQDGHGNLSIAQPGTSSLRPGEALVKTIDLRPRTYIFGPADENPFEPQQTNEDEIMARHRVRRRLETQAFTQDGFEIVANIIVDFRVKSTHYSLTAPFGFHPGYAFQALRKDYAADKTFTEGHQSGGINRLPGELAIKAWRETLQCFTLDELFTPLDGGDGLASHGTLFGLEFAMDYVNQLLQRQFVDEIAQYGRTTGRQVFSEAFNELEQAGLEILRVWVVNPRMEPEKEDEFVSRYFNAWHSAIKDLQMQVQAMYSEIEAENRQQALVGFAKAAVQSLAEGMERYQTLPANFLYLNRSLYLLLRGTRSLGRLTEAEKNSLDRLLGWLESNLEM